MVTISLKEYNSLNKEIAELKDTSLVPSIEAAFSNLVGVARGGAIKEELGRIFAEQGLIFHVTQDTTYSPKVLIKRRDPKDDKNVHVKVQ